MTASTLVTLTNPRSPASEAYRTLRTNLIFSSVQEPLSTLIVTSPAPEEGKSVTLANLAVTFAQSGKNTVIVDCDLRRPSQHGLWGVDQQPGLTTMVLDGLKKPPYVEVGVENLRLVPAGPLPPNPADLLGSPRMDAIVAQIKKDADVVLFDTPPVMAVTDATLLAAKLDGVLLVLKAGSTRRDHAEQIKELFDRLHIRLVGAVLTGAVIENQVRGYYSE
jgi:non-specific protein-tyrosine kinase